MSKRIPTPDPPLPAGMDYTDPRYWQGSIKLSLTRFFVLAVIARQPMHAYAVRPCAMSPMAAAARAKARSILCSRTWLTGDIWPCNPGQSAGGSGGSTG